VISFLSSKITTCNKLTTIITMIINRTAGLHQEMEALHSGHPGIAYGFRATLEQEIGVHVRHERGLHSYVPFRSSPHCSLLLYLPSATPRLRLAAIACSTWPSHPSCGNSSNLAARLEEPGCLTTMPDSLPFDPNTGWLLQPSHTPSPPEFTNFWTSIRNATQCNATQW
jgi:hypothetical protein